MASMGYQYVMQPMGYPPMQQMTYAVAPVGAAAPGQNPVASMTYAMAPTAQGQVLQSHQFVAAGPQASMQLPVAGPAVAAPVMTSGMWPSAHQQQAAAAASTVSTDVSEVEVLTAVESLYNDQLRPYGRILRKRLAEISSAAGRGDAEVNDRELRAVCTASHSLKVEDTEGSDWAVSMAAWPDAFIDVYSPEDVYPQSLWAEFSAFAGAPANASMVLPGGRYSCAQSMIQRGLPWLERYSLGQVCHIVQLAISKKKLLGYLNGTLVPYSRSQSMVKDRQAVTHQPCAAHSKIPVASWDVLRQCVRELVEEVRAGAAPIPLSNIKRLFRSRFHVELSETALGYAKVSELLQDSHFSDLCEVKLRGHGYVIQPAAPRREGNFISLAEGLHLDDCSLPGPFVGGMHQPQHGALVQQSAAPMLQASQVMQPATTILTQAHPPAACVLQQQQQPSQQVLGQPAVAQQAVVCGGGLVQQPQQPLGAVAHLPQAPPQVQQRGSPGGAPAAVLSMRAAPNAGFLTSAARPQVLLPLRSPRVALGRRQAVSPSPRVIVSSPASGVYPATPSPSTCRGLSLPRLLTSSRTLQAPVFGSPGRTLKQSRSSDALRETPATTGKPRAGPMSPVAAKSTALLQASSPVLTNVPEDSVARDITSPVGSPYTLPSPSPSQFSTPSRYRFPGLSQEPNFGMPFVGRESSYMAPTTSEMKASVRNTFIYARVPPSSPVKTVQSAARCRANTLPTLPTELA